MLNKDGYYLRPGVESLPVLPVPGGPLPAPPLAVVAGAVLLGLVAVKILPSHRVEVGQHVVQGVQVGENIVDLSILIINSMKLAFNYYSPIELL